MSLTGVVPRSMRNVFEPSTYSVGMSNGAASPTKDAAYTPLSPRAKERSAKTVSFTTTPPPTVVPANYNPIGICGLNPAALSKEYGDLRTLNAILHLADSSFK